MQFISFEGAAPSWHHDRRSVARGFDSIRQCRVRWSMRPSIPITEAVFLYTTHAPARDVQTTTTQRDCRQ